MVSLQEQAVDMVLTDYCMPEMTGYDLLKAVKVLRSQSLHLCISARVCVCSVPAIQFHSVSLSHAAKPNMTGAEPPEADPGDRHVVRRRAPADQQVSLAPPLFSSFEHQVLEQSYIEKWGNKKKGARLRSL